MNLTPLRAVQTPDAQHNALTSLRGSRVRARLFEYGISFFL